MQVPGGVRGIDLSANQQPARCRYAELAAYASFAWVRVTEGDTPDDTHRAHRDGLAGSGCSVGPYCFGRPRHPAVEEADRFLEGLSDRAWDLAPVLDIERGDDRFDRLPPAELLAWARAWLERVEAAGRAPVVYGSCGFLDERLPPDHDLGRYGLWVAHYGVARPTLPRGWSSAIAWQWTGSGAVPGFDGSIDCSVTDSIDLLLGSSSESFAIDTDPPRSST